ncbi:pyridoxamine 5'-phosphate oxidase family protein [Streptomyces prunicolor]|uniref:pyridoxamine 5'-phosphate oxidase family protein n=1 Tax=Streptomyces prunicolor TaxID=67348 RepID=UPI0034483896
MGPPRRNRTRPCRTPDRAVRSPAGTCGPCPAPRRAEQKRAAEAGRHPGDHAVASRGRGRPVAARARTGRSRARVHRAERGPAQVPARYARGGKDRGVDGAILFRTAAGSTPSLAVDHAVAFEVDRIDDAFSRGWSVLVRGRARRVTDADEACRLAAGAHSGPWPGGGRELWVRVEPETVTGRRITL